jgi:hypothetical protein
MKRDGDEVMRREIQIFGRVVVPAATIPIRGQKKPTNINSEAASLLAMMQLHS